jgi:uncharacterized protein (TIGR03066 family)
MNAPRWLGVGLVACLLGAGARADDKADYAKLIVGKWEITKTESGGAPPGAIIEFTKDGKVKAQFKKDDADVTIEGTYKVEGNKFIMAIKRGDEERTQTITISKISDKEMTAQGEDGKTVELTKKK